MFLLQSPGYSGYDWQGNEKKKNNNTGNCKALCISCNAKYGGDT